MVDNKDILKVKQKKEVECALEGCTNRFIPKTINNRFCSRRCSGRQWLISNRDEIKEKRLKYYQENTEKLQERRATKSEYMKKYNKEYYEKNKVELMEYQKMYKLNNAEKMKTYFRRYGLLNRDRINSEHKKYYVDNRDKILDAAAQYRKKNIERVSEYHKKNRVKINLYRRKKYHENPIYNLVCKIRSRTRTCIASKKLKKDLGFYDYLGCTGEELYKHIQGLFTDGMSWELVMSGKIEIDHIIPLATADSIEDVYRLSHFLNLQPLWVKDNRKKSNKLDWVR